MELETWMEWRDGMRRHIFTSRAAIESAEPGRHRDLAAETLRWLDKLGTTSDQIATTLGDLGVTGTLRQITACPLVRYLAPNLDVEKVAVGHTRVVLQVNANELVHVPLDTAPRCFVIRFDAGEFPQLADHNEDDVATP